MPTSLHGFCSRFARAAVSRRLQSPLACERRTRGYSQAALATTETHAAYDEASIHAAAKEARTRSSIPVARDVNGFREYAHDEPVRGRDLVYKVLLSQRVSTVFGIPARSQAVDPFNNLYQSPELKSFVPVQEQCAGHMAEGYARATGKPGIVVATSAHAIPSLVTPMQDALMDGTPMVVLYSLSLSSGLGLDEFQSPDSFSMAESCTKWTTRVRHLGELEVKLRSAFDISLAGRPGPVMVEVPPSMLAERVSLFSSSYSSISSSLPSTFETWMPQYLKLPRTLRPHDSLEATLTRVAAMVDQAERPILFVGQGMLASPQGPAVLKEFAERTNMPVTTTLQGLGAFDETDDKSLHMLGLHGSMYANRAIQAADLIMALGARFDDRVTGALAKFAPGARGKGGRGIVHFEISPKNVDKVVTATEAVIGDCTANLAQLTPLTRRVDARPKWWAQINEWKRAFPLSAYNLVSKPASRIRPQDVVAKLSELTAPFKERVLISTGVGQHQMWAAQHFRWRYPRTMLTSGGLGTMGYGLPAAIGAKVARPECLVIDIDGDASFGMTMAELATMACRNIAVKVLIFNNEEMGMISDLQRLYYDERFHQNNHINPDFVALSESYGVAATRAVKPGEVAEKLKWLIEYNGPALLEVITEKNAPVWPVVPAGKGLHEGITYPAVRI